MSQVGAVMTTMRCANLIASLLIFLHGLNRSSGARILISQTNAMSSKSHSFSLATIAEGLVDRGHHVTLLTGSSKSTEGFGRGSFNESLIYYVPYTRRETEALTEKFTRVSFRKKSIFDYSDILPVAHEFFGVVSGGCRSLFAEPSHLDRLRSGSYDTVIGIPFASCDALLAAYLNTTFIAFTPTFRYEAFSEDILGIPAPNSYVPFPLIEALTDEMTFFQRLYNLFYRYIFVKYLLHVWAKPYVEVQREHGIAPGMTINQISGKAQLWLVHTNFALDFPRPTAPVWIPVGGLLARPPAPLPEDLEAFVQGAGKHGVIVFSLGSAVTSLMDDSLNELFAKVFSELPQRVLWRYVGPPLHNLGNNTRLLKWIPQNDLLGHPQTRLLMYHGGVNGVYEALYHGVPMVLLPIFADQPAIGARVTKKGMGVVLDRAKLSHDLVKGAIEEVIHNPKYKVSITHFSSIHRDTLSSPLDTAVFWIEHVLKFGGDHLRLRGSELDFLVLNSVDVIAFIVFLAIIIIFVDFLIAKACWKYVFAKCLLSRVSKPKSD